MVAVIALAAPGFEPIELLAPVDVLRRAGANVTIAAVQSGSNTVNGSHGITIVADANLSELKGKMYDAIIVPGGMPGTTNLASSEDVLELIRTHHAAGKYITAICAAPGYVLAEAAQLLNGKKACGYPGTEEKITNNGGHLQNDSVVVDGKIITSRGPGTAIEYGLAIVKELFDQETSDKVAQQVLFH